MSDKANKEWILPASIPFENLKRRDLEECVYWLLDAMGAKDLEWRTGGSGDGTADGGRDLEAHFYTPGADGEVESQKWWIECKGRKGTVESSEVKSAVNNALAIEGLDYVVIATNTQFSNPTRDWVKEWQAKHPRPRVKLWDHSQLERYLSRHPDVVLRLFSEALSSQGRFQAMESRFWNKLEFVTPKALADLWKVRREIELTGMGLFAAVVNEFANGNITHRPWGAFPDAPSLVGVLQTGLLNVSYLMMRSVKGGVDLKPVCRALAYLILTALDVLPAQNVAQLVTDSVFRGKADEMPEHVQQFLLMPIADQLLSEMQDVCSSDCRRMSCTDRSVLTDDKDEIDEYWLRLESDGLKEAGERRSVRIEFFDAPCVVGFPVDKERHCPLFLIEPSVKNTEELLAIIKRVAAFRKAQAAQKREEEKQKEIERVAQIAQKPLA
ncbi:restriction endonuclease [Bradyrhizobium barranii]|uniref:Restriction endonuclease n=1 Tax=Bradyrhizobium barranii TaxID=2992140 RepID=A0ABY3QWS3_9BRAD|nr:restriction endonuclease [Bradyrhizobium japonicum]UFW90490.1 restriction endonuclease [Bradyrhizobium japonicum]